MRWMVFFSVCLLIFTGCNPQGRNLEPSGEPAYEDYPILGKAPELSTGTWIKTPEALSLAGLKGKVILLDMWTFG